MGDAGPPGFRSGPRTATKLLAVAPFLLVFLSACAELRTTEGEASISARALFEKGSSSAAEGRFARAESAFRLALRDSPRFVEAHRALQDLLESTFRGHEALESYRKRLGRRPGDPCLLYLLGRIEPDPGEQSALFRRAWRIDPDGYWSNLAMGYSLYQDRSFPAALRFFRRAVRARPREARGWRFLGETLTALRRFEPALEALARASRLDPDEDALPLRSAQILLFTGRRSEAFLLLRSLLEAEARPRYATRDLLRRILRDEADDALCRSVWAVERKNLEDHPEDPAVLSFFGYLCLELGNPAKASKSLARALERGAPPSRVVLDLRLALFGTGKYGRAFSIWREKAAAAPWELPGNEAAARFRAVEAGIEALGTGEDPGRLLALGRALTRCGWVREAVPVLRRAAGAGHPEAPRALSRALDHLEFVRRLRVFLNGAYLEYFEERDGGDLDDTLEGVSRLSMEVLGEDLGAGNAVRSYFFVGEIVDADAKASPLVRYFEEFNKFLVLGRKSGGTPEAVLMNTVVRNRSARFSHAQGPVTCDVAVGEDFELGSFGEYLGGAILGVSLLGRFYVNLDEVVDRNFKDLAALRKALVQRSSLEAFGSWRASTRREACVLDAGAGLSHRLVLAAFPEAGAPERATGTAYAGVVDHELMHVDDANRYLPIGAHPLAALGLGIKHGFSQTSIEAEMEERAALAAMLLGERPHLELLHILSFAPYTESRLPHSRGYCRLLDRLLKHLYDHPEDYPSLDRTRNLCRQLHRLSKEELLRAARSLARESGIVD